MNLAHPDIKRKMEDWQNELRELTGNNLILVLAYTPPSLKYCLRDVVVIVCEETGLPIARVNSKTRKPEVARVKQLISYYGNTAGISLKSIASELGYRDHSSVIHGRDKIKNFIETGDDEVCELVVKINKRLEDKSDCQG